MTQSGETPVVAMPTADGTAVLRPLTFANLYAKAEWIDAMASLDATQPPVRILSTRIAKARGPNNLCGIARDLHDWVRDHIPYVFGAGHQRFYSSAELLSPTDGTEQGGNCADKSRLFVALCRSVELESRIVPIFHTAEAFSHVQAQVKCPGSESDPRSEPGGWLRAELIVAGVPLGSGPNAGAHDANGRLLLA